MTTSSLCCFKESRQLQSILESNIRELLLTAEDLGSFKNSYLVTLLNAKNPKEHRAEHKDALPFSTRTGQYLQTSLRTNDQTRQAGGKKAHPCTRGGSRCQPAETLCLTIVTATTDSFPGSLTVISASSVIDRRLYSGHIR